MPRTAHRLVRLAAGLSVVAASSAATLLTAVPAHAATPVTVSMTGSLMRINGSDGGESIRVGTLNGFVTVSNSIGSVQAGPGCRQLGGVVRCDGVTNIGYNGNNGDDSFRNDTSLRVSGSGGNGADRLFGGPGDDALRGGFNSDLVNGGAGTDFCDAEAESSCERDFPPPPRIRVPR